MIEKNDLDMFKLAEEVAKQKTAQDVNLDSIFSDLDSVTNSHSYATSGHEETQRVIKPALPGKISDYTTRYEAFKNLIEAVSYGTNNSEEYVRGHRDALEACSETDFKNRKNMSLYEDNLNKEIAEYPSRYNLYDKGYYDGMFYVLKAVRRSMELAMDNLVKELRAQL